MAGNSLAGQVPPSACSRQTERCNMQVASGDDCVGYAALPTGKARNIAQSTGKFRLPPHASSLPVQGNESYKAAWRKGNRTSLPAIGNISAYSIENMPSYPCSLRSVDACQTDLGRNYTGLPAMLADVLEHGTLHAVGKVRVSGTAPKAVRDGWICKRT